MAGSDAAAREVPADRPGAAAVFVKRVALARGRREAEALAAIDHPGVVRLLGWSAEDGSAKLRLALIEGRDLEAVLAAGAMPAQALADLLVQLSEATAAIHAAGFLHRDLKPGNIRILKSGAPVIVDLGAAARLDDAPGEASWLTDGYAAPEQYLRDEREGPWTDVYAIGAIGFRALSGQPPPPAPKRLLGAPLPAIAGELPAGLRRAIEAALALDPAARPASAEALRDLLRSCPEASDGYPPTIEVERVARRTLATRAERAQPAASAPTRRSRWPWALLGLVLLAGLAGAAGLYGRPYYERWLKQDWLVDPAGAGDATTIGDALARSGAGATIRIAPGTYAESLSIAHVVHLRPADPTDPPLIAPETGPCALLSASSSSLQNLRLRAPAGEAGTDCIVARADVVIEDNQVGSPAGAAIVIGAGAAPSVLGNSLENGRIGIAATEGSAGVIAGNRLLGQRGPGLLIRGGSRPRISGNRLEGAGAVFLEGAGGVFQDNQILNSPASAVVITSGADPVLRDNRIAGAGEAAVHVYGDGRGTLEANHLEEAKLSGVVVEEGGRLTLERNTIERSGEHGVLVVDGAGATIRGNTITGSGGHGIALGPGAAAELEENELSGNQAPDLLDARAQAEPGA